MSVTKLLDQASFQAFGHYHHDLCINTWRSEGGSTGAGETTDLYRFAIAYGDLEALLAFVQHVRSAGIPIEDVVDHGVSLSVYLRDPGANDVELSWELQAGTWRSEDGALRMGYSRIASEQLVAADL